MSQNKTSTGSRDVKRARFSAEERKKSNGASPVVLIAGLVVVLALIGGTVFMLARSSPASTASAANPASQAPGGSPGLPAVSASQTGSQALLVKAATVGHDAYPAVTADNGVVRLPLSTFDDGNAHFYTYMHEGQPIEFFVLKSKDGVVRAAFNACDVCFPAKKGYHQEGDEMVCNNCGSRFPAAQINVVRGGCNPSPLTRTIDGDSLAIQVSDLIGGLGFFQG